ncbi:hypothetical protein ACFLYE_04875 [Chloroflexota bacterium]
MFGLKRKLEQLDRNLAIAGMAAGLVAIPLLRFIAPGYIGTGIALTVSCVIYLILRRKASWELSISKLDSATLRLVLNILFFALLCSSLISLYSTAYDRPLAYFIFLAFMSTVVALEIFTMRKETTGYTAFILIKILAIAISLRWSLYYMFPGSLFGSDPWYAVQIFARIASAGHLLGSDIGGYYYMPVMHIVVVMTSQLTGLDPRNSLLFSLGLFAIISLVFIFLLGSKLVGKKVGLLAALLLAIDNLHILGGWWPVAQTLGFSLGTLVIFLVLRPIRGNTGEFKVITLLVLVVMILTHHLSSAVTLVILFLLFIGYQLFTSSHRNTKRLTGISFTIVLFFGISLLAYSMYVSRFFNLFAYISIGSGDVTPYPVLVAPGVTTNPIWFELDKLGPLLFYTLAVIGLLSILNLRNANSSLFSLAFCGVFLTALTFILFIFPVKQIFIGRWFVFLQIALAIPAALGLVSICSVINRNWLARFMLGTITFLLVSLMILNTSASFDSPIYPRYATRRLALMESELYAASTIKSVYDGKLTTDSYYTHAFMDKLELGVKQLTVLDVQTEFSEVDGLLLLREYSAEELMMIRGPKGYYRVEPEEFLARLNEGGFNHIYDCGTVSAYSK